MVAECVETSTVSSGPRVADVSLPECLREIEDAGGGSDLIIAHNVAILPPNVANVTDHRVTFLRMRTQ